MSLSEKEVEHIAELAKIKITEKEKSNLQNSSMRFWNFSIN